MHIFFISYVYLCILQQCYNEIALKMKDTTGKNRRTNKFLL
jgi:hypothetical protein